MSSITKYFICSSQTKPKKLAVAITKELAKRNKVFVDSIGAEAVNNAIKAVCYAQEKAEHNPDVSGIFCKPYLMFTKTTRNEFTVVTRIEVW